MQRNENRYDVKLVDIAVIDNIPDGWKINRLGFFFTFGKGLSITKENLQDIGVPCVSYGEIHSKYGFEVNPQKNFLRCVDEKYLRTDRKSLLKYGDFLFADTSEDLDGSGNFTYLNSNEKTFAGYHTIILRARETINHRHIAYMFDSISFRTQIRNKVWGIKVYSITQLILKNAKIILPPLKEQQAIVIFLDTQCNRIDSIIVEMEQQIEVLKQYKTSLITETVTKGLDKSVSMKDSRIDWLGNIPVHWAVKQIKYTCDIIMGQSPDSSEVNEINGKYQFMQGNSEFTDLYPNPILFCDKPKKRCRIGDILMSVRAPVGEMNISDKIYGIGRGLCSIKPLRLFDKYFWYFMLKSKGDFNFYANGSTFDAITTANLLNFPIIVPPLKEQRAIATFLDTQCSHIDNILAEKHQSIETMRAYKKSLIYEYVTGKKRVKGSS
jgi:type I restriction enzyme S subunit